MHPYETASDSFIGDDQYHLRRDSSLFTLFFQNKRHKHKIFFPRILDAMSISVCAERQPIKAENVAGGAGYILKEELIKGEQLGAYCKMFNEVTLKPGCEIGYHDSFPPV